jgi:hypothetical protein
MAVYAMSPRVVVRMLSLAALPGFTPRLVSFFGALGPCMMMRQTCQGEWVLGKQKANATNLNEERTPQKLRVHVCWYKATQWPKSQRKCVIAQCDLSKTANTVLKICSVSVIAQKS